MLIAADFKTVQFDHSIPGKDCRGLFAFSNTSVSVLVRRGSCVGSCPYCGPPGPCPPGDGMFFVLKQVDGSTISHRQIDDRITDFSLGSGRLAYGRGNWSKYGAYYKVHSISTMCEPLQPG